MRRILVSICFLFLLLFSGRAQAAVDIGVSVGDEGIRSFYLAVGDYYRVPEREIIIIRERRVPDDEIPVVLFIAHRVGVAPAVIIDLRLGGISWMDIIVRYRLTPEIFYVPVRVGPPYGKAYGHYMNRPQREWRALVLSDAEVVNLVNLRFISEHYGYPPEEVIKMREGGRGFVSINKDVKAKKTPGKQKEAPGKGKGTGKK
jgi:hypothetical protein